MRGSLRKRAERATLAPDAARGSRHRGDIMSPAKRSALMARIKGKNTGLEMLLAKAFAQKKLRWESHAADLPGRPDFVFRRRRVVVFVDGDFWHGWRFPVWRDKLTSKWEQKISGNRRRDLKVHRALRRVGWRIVRIWEHQVERDLDACVLRVRQALARSKGRRPGARQHELDLV